MSDITFTGEILKVAHGRDTNNCWADVTFRVPIAPQRLDASNEMNILDAFRSRTVMHGELTFVNMKLFPESSEPADPAQGKLKVS